MYQAIPASERNIEETTKEIFSTTKYTYKNELNIYRKLYPFIGDKKSCNFNIARQLLPHL